MTIAIHPSAPGKAASLAPIALLLSLLFAVSPQTRAQSSALPDEPRPVTGSRLLGLIEAEAIIQSDGPAAQSTQIPAPPAAQADAPQLTMFPHSDTARYWISGQTNTIFQGKPGFHSPYQGANSLDNAAEYKTSLVETLFLGYQPHHNLRFNTDLLLDVETPEAGASARRWGSPALRTSTWCAIPISVPHLTSLVAASTRPSV